MGMIIIITIEAFVKRKTIKQKSGMFSSNENFIILTYQHDRVIHRVINENLTNMNKPFGYEISRFCFKSSS